MEAAVVSASQGALGTLIGKLGDLLTAKYHLFQEAKGQIMFLRAELESMHVFLKRISDTEEPDEQDRCWAKEVRELSYDIDDSVDDFIHRIEESESNSRACGFKGLMERCINLLTTMNTRYEITKEFQGLKRRVMEVSERRMRYKVDGAVSKPNNTAIDLRLVALHAETANLVGIKGPRDQLIQLMDAEGVPVRQVKVISIVGFGGLGKTTLANEIYRKLEGKFQCRAFVSVSQKPNINKILRTTLSQVGFVAKDTNMEMWEESELITELRKFLLNKRYIIVIDDIWDVSAWDIIRCALPESMNGSRVITTTRIDSVARACCTNHIECVYKMKVLSDQDSRIFGSEDTCPPYLNEVAAEILKKCGGLPLAIITTSSLLANQPNKLRKEQWEYVRNSLSSNLENPSLEGMRQILNLSYINLPHYLKTCILYLGIYPEDYTIYKNDLARQWVAEGFISKVRGIDPEDIAKSYFNELINRSMIQPTDTDYNGEVMSCKVHDMMLDLILHKCREENFVTLIDDIQEMTGHVDKIRRLSFNLDDVIDYRVMGSLQLSQTRTLARIGTSSQLPPFLLFKHLRVLIIEISQEHWPSPLLDFSGICHLYQLRCLKIVAKSYHVVLPSKIGGLRQLETFEIETEVPYKEQSFMELPSDIVHMSRLLHLIVPGMVKLPDGIVNMRSLHTLCCFNLYNSPENIKSLGALTNLTYHEISCDQSSHTIASKGKNAEICRDLLRTCLENLCNLKSLIVHIKYLTGSWCLDALSPVPTSFHHLQRLHTSYVVRFSRIPQWIGQYRSLYDLVLSVDEVLQDGVRMLAKLPSLIHLYLIILRVPKDRIIIDGNNGFPVLKHFKLLSSRLPHLAFEEGAMSKLERLELWFDVRGWETYGSPPAGMEHLSGLKEISVEIAGAFAKESSIMAAESALRDAADRHPHCPVANIKTDRYKRSIFEKIR